jgi:hypothetical protein
MVPMDQTADNWTEMVRVQIFQALKATPGQFKIKLDQARARLCPENSSQPVAHASENGYATARVVRKLFPQHSYRQAGIHMVQSDSGQ